MSKISKLRDERGKLITDMRKIIDTADTETRAKTAEENEQITKMKARAKECLGEIREEEEQIELERDSAVVDETRDINNSNETPEVRTERLVDEQFNLFLRTGRIGPELRAMQQDSDVDGGYLVSPVKWVEGLIKKMDKLVMVRQKATVFTVSDAKALGQTSLDVDATAPIWTGEISETTETAGPKLGARELHPALLAKLLKLSMKLVKSSGGRASILIQDQLALIFSYAQENAYWNGDGTLQPLGMFVASDSGIPSSRDVQADNTALELTAKSFIKTKYKVRPAYWATSEWYMHQDIEEMLVEMKDGNGRYLYLQDFTSDSPGRLLGRPVNLSEFAPSTIAADAYAALFGDLKNYHIADADNLEIQVIDQTYAAKHKFGYIGRYYGDGMPVLGEAFARNQFGS